MPISSVDQLIRQNNNDMLSTEQKALQEHKDNLQLLEKQEERLSATVNETKELVQTKQQEFFQNKSATVALIEQLSSSIKHFADKRKGAAFTDFNIASSDYQKWQAEAAGLIYELKILSANDNPTDLLRKLKDIKARVAALVNKYSDAIKEIKAVILEPTDANKAWSSWYAERNSINNFVDQANHQIQELENQIRKNLQPAYDALSGVGDLLRNANSGWKDARDKVEKATKVVDQQQKEVTATEGLILSDLRNQIALRNNSKTNLSEDKPVAEDAFLSAIAVAIFEAEKLRTSLHSKKGVKEVNFEDAPMSLLDNGEDSFKNQLISNKVENINSNVTAYLAAEYLVTQLRRVKKDYCEDPGRKLEYGSKLTRTLDDVNKVLSHHRGWRKVVYKVINAFNILRGRHLDQEQIAAKARFFLPKTRSQKSLETLQSNYINNMSAA